MNVRIMGKGILILLKGFRNLIKKIYFNSEVAVVNKNLSSF